LNLVANLFSKHMLAAIEVHQAELQRNKSANIEVKFLKILCFTTKAP